MARVAQLTPQFRAYFDQAGVSKAPSQRRHVMRVIGLLAAGPLPLEGDLEALLPWPGGTAWTHPLPALGLWLQYQFDDEHVVLLTLVTREPVFV